MTASLRCGDTIASGAFRLFLLFLMLVLGACSSTGGRVRGIDNWQRNLLSREVKERSLRYLAASAALEEQLDSFQGIVNITDQRQLRAALNEQEQVEGLYRSFREAAEDLDSHLESRKKQLKAEDMDHLLDLRDLTGSRCRNFADAWGEYLAVRRRLLDWGKSGGASRKDFAAQAEYGSLSDDFEKTQAKAYDRFLDHIRFKDRFMTAHPELADYLADGTSR